MASSSDDYLVPDRQPCAACEVQSASGSDYGRDHTCGLRRVTFDSIAWERIPEQAVCICAHVKGVHAHNPRPNVFGCSHAIGEPGEDLRGCRCPDFHDADHPMPWVDFGERFLGAIRNPYPFIDAIFEGDKAAARRRLALTWAWKQSGLGLTEPRTWSIWMADSKRVWRAWRDAGSPITAFGKETSFGVASIPALEDR